MKNDGSYHRLWRPERAAARWGISLFFANVVMYSGLPWIPSPDSQLLGFLLLGGTGVLFGFAVGFRAGWDAKTEHLFSSPSEEDAAK